MIRTTHDRQADARSGAGDDGANASKAIYRKAVLFLKKRTKKTFAPSEPGVGYTTGPSDKVFCGAFF